MSSGGSRSRCHKALPSQGLSVQKCSAMPRLGAQLGGPKGATSCPPAQWPWGNAPSPSVGETHAPLWRHAVTVLAAMPLSCGGVAAWQRSQAGRAGSGRRLWGGGRGALAPGAPEHLLLRHATARSWQPCREGPSDALLCQGGGAAVGRGGAPPSTSPSFHRLPLFPHFLRLLELGRQPAGWCATRLALPVTEELELGSCASAVPPPRPSWPSGGSDVHGPGILHPVQLAAEPRRLQPQLLGEKRFSDTSGYSGTLRAALPGQDRWGPAPPHVASVAAGHWPFPAASRDGLFGRRLHPAPWPEEPQALPLWQRSAATDSQRGWPLRGSACGPGALAPPGVGLPVARRGRGAADPQPGSMMGLGMPYLHRPVVLLQCHRQRLHPLPRLWNRGGGEGVPGLGVSGRGRGLRRGPRAGGEG